MEYCDHKVYYSVRHFSIFGIAGISTPVREVENYPDNMVLNWSTLERKHNIKNTQGEIAKTVWGSNCKRMVKICWC
jgi:hypothetical protein